MLAPGIRGPASGNPPLDGLGINVDLLRRIGRRQAVLGTKLRFTRRLVTERRIRFTHVGRHVRIPESALREFIKAGTVEPVTVTRKGRAA
jgi:excisionase family DNA binding protein